MRFVSFQQGQSRGLATVQPSGEVRGYLEDHTAFPGSLDALIQAGEQTLRAVAQRLADGPVIDMSSASYLPPFLAPGKILCVGLNYADHSKESGYELPPFPAVFGRFTSSLVGHNQPLIRPKVSTQLDYEGEIVAVIGKSGRHISRNRALDYVAGYSLFNDASVRDYQHMTPQWTVGKNFDGTGAFGPEFVTAGELSEGAQGLKLQTRLNGEIVQNASTDDLVFDVASLVSLLSQAMALHPGDIIVTGTPAGVGVARQPQLFMKSGDICEVEVEGIGVLRNPIKDEQP